MSNQLFVCLVVMVGLLSCNPTATPRGDARARASPLQLEAIEAPATEAVAESPWQFATIGKRDPFHGYFRERDGARVPQTCGDGSVLQQYQLEQLELVGIVTGVSEPRALVRSPGGDGHIIGRDTLLGQHCGRVTAIHNGEVIVTQKYRDASGIVVSNDTAMKL